MKRNTINRLNGIILRKKQHAHHVGRYDAPHTHKSFDERDKSKAFRCISYVEDVMDINAIEDAIKTLRNIK